MDDIFKIKITKNIRNKLIELGIYYSWLKYTKKRFNKYRTDVCVGDIRNSIQECIDDNNIPNLLHKSFNWHDTSEGYEYWFNVYSNQQRFILKSRMK